MSCTEKKIQDILFEIEIKGVGNILPQTAQEYLRCIQNFKVNDEKLKNKLKSLEIQLKDQAKLSINDFDDYQKQQRIVDLILRLDRTTRNLLIQNGLDAFVLVQDNTQKKYLEEINFTLSSMTSKPSLEEVVNMFKI